MQFSPKKIQEITEFCLFYEVIVKWGEYWITQNLNKLDLTPKASV